MIFVFYAVFGGFFLFADLDLEQDEEFFNPGIIFMIIGIIGGLITIAFGVVTILASKYIKEKRKFDFIFVVAILNCLTGVLGILLGVFTIIELNKPEVRQLFENNKK